MGDAAHSCIPCFVLGLTDIHAHNIAHGPCRLEVKTSGDAIDIGHFACEKQVCAVLALQGIEVEFAQGYAATGDKLVLEFALAGDGILVINLLIIFLPSSPIRRSAGHPHFSRMYVHSRDVRLNGCKLPAILFALLAINI